MLGRVALTALAFAALAGCARRGGTSPHEHVACVGCHRGGPGSAARSGVPDASCTSRGCHPGGGPDSIRLEAVTFRHQDHPDGVGGSVTCAACHTHGPDSLTLRAGTTACALCHFQQIQTSADSGCALCHAHPRHTRRTSQGLALPHAALDQAKVPCTRCHYRLIEHDTTVSPDRCKACHAPAAPHALPGDSARPRTAADTVLNAALAHAKHRELACIACHEKVVHRVVAMSTSIELRCVSCHALRHRPAIPADSAPDSTCAGCHANVHQDQQRIVLGLLPGDSARPSAMFMGGVTCQSCHVASDQQPPRPGAPLRGTAASCTGCHGGAWGQILGRWQRGYARRDGWVSLYLAQARAATGEAAPAVKAKLKEAQDLLDFVRRAGPLHNLPLADRLMRRAVALTGDAYRLARVPVAPPPALGPAVTNGSCISCHYGIEESRIRISSDSGRFTTHGDHLLRGGLTCDACHAVGAAPPGMGGATWNDPINRPRDSAGSPR